MVHVLVSGYRAIFCRQEFDSDCTHQAAGMTRFDLIAERKLPDGLPDASSSRSSLAGGGLLTDATGGTTGRLCFSPLYDIAGESGHTSL